MEALKKEMTLNGESAITLAEKLKVSPSAITGWIKGTFKPKPKTVQKMIALGYSEKACLTPSEEVKV